MKIVKVPKYKMLNEVVFDLDDFDLDSFDSGEMISLDNEISSIQSTLDAALNYDDRKNQVKQWFKNIGAEDVLKNLQYSTGPDGRIVVSSLQTINLSNLKITAFPFKWGKIFGNFIVSFNELTSFNNFPYSVEGYVNANFNRIKNFDGICKASKNNLGTLRDVKLTLEAQKQKCKTKYTLTDRHYKMYLNGVPEERLLENRVYVTNDKTKKIFSGTLKDINEKEEIGIVKLDNCKKLKKISLKNIYPLESLD